MSNQKIDTPPVSFIFKLSIKGQEDNNGIGFQEASGINAEMNVEEVGSGGENRFKYRLPGVVKYNNLVLKRGLLPKDSTLYQWIVNTLDQSLNNNILTKNLAVSLLDGSGQVMISWDFINAYPVKWEVSDLKSTEDVLTVESLELAYNYFKKN